MIFLQIECSFQCTLTNDAFGYFQQPNSNPFNQPPPSTVGLAFPKLELWSKPDQASESKKVTCKDVSKLSVETMTYCWWTKPSFWPVDMVNITWIAVFEQFLLVFCRGCCPSTVWLNHRFWVGRIKLKYGPVEDRYRPGEKHLVVEQVWMPWYTVSQMANPSNLCYLVPSNFSFMNSWFSVTLSVIKWSKLCPNRCCRFLPPLCNWSLAL